MQKKGIIQGAFILTLANLITRVLGFVYRIYMSKEIGSEGMGLYQLIMPIYMLIWSISSSGFSTTISKLTAQENAKKNYGNMGRILKQSVSLSTIIALALSIITFYFSDYIALCILKDVRCSLSLKILSLCYPFMAAGSCIRGYFFGLQETSVPAISQVFEQLVRMALIYFFADFFIPKGITYACGIAVIGMCMGEFFSFIYVFLSYKSFKSKHKLNKKPLLTPLQAYFLILSMAVPLTLNRVTGSFLSTIENILIPQRLKIYGLNMEEAISLYGELSGMAMPLLMFPSSLLTAIATALVPAVSEAQATKNNKRIKSTVSKALLLTSVIGFGSAGIFLTFPELLGEVIYSNANIGKLLKALSIVCPFLYLQVTLSGILNGLGKQLFIFRMSLISSCINISFIFFMIPKYGINAFIFGWFIATALISFISMLKIKAETKITFDLMHLILKPSLSIVLACLISRLFISKLFFNNLSIFSLFSALMLSGSLYFILLFISGCLNKEDFKDLINNI